jgi:site-specific recombinase XerD
MLEFFFKRPSTLRFLRSGSSSPHLDGFAAELRVQGYPPSTAQMLIRGAAHLGSWPGARRVLPRSFDDELLTAFGRHLRHCLCFRRDLDRRTEFHRGARRFLAFLRRAGIARRSEPVAVDKPAHRRILGEFLAWMRRYRGVQESTLAQYAAKLRYLLMSLGPEPSKYTAAGLRRSFLRRTRGFSRNFAGNVATATRMFLQFLIAEGRCDVGLGGAIPTVVHWRLSSLPKYIPKADVNRVLAASLGKTLVRVRDRAILLLLARLGLRGGDVRGLKLDDIDWEAGTIRLSGKGGTEDRLPLPQGVGDAILHYLKKRQQPVVGTSHVFLTVRAPARPLAAHGTIANIVKVAIDRAGVSAPTRGPHLFRHSVATGLLREGSTLGEVSALLRHRSLRTTSIYAKVDFNLLKTVAQPWPSEALP